MRQGPDGASPSFELGEIAPVFALIRGWCGENSLDDYNQVQALRAEVSRLRELVQSAAQWLRDHGRAAKATGVLKELSRTEKPT